MGMTGSEWIWWEGWDDMLSTYEVNMPPSDVSAETWMRGSEGFAITGIHGYRRRLPSGADEPVMPGGWRNLPWCWPPVINDYVSAITFGSFCGEDDAVYFVARIDHYQ